jgi:hypothetical protein
LYDIKVLIIKNRPSKTTICRPLGYVIEKVEEKIMQQYHTIWRISVIEFWKTKKIEWFEERFGPTNILEINGKKISKS